MNKIAIFSFVVSLLSVWVYSLAVRTNASHYYAWSLVGFVTTLLLCVIAMVQITRLKQKGVLFVLLGLILPFAFLAYLLLGFSAAG